MVNWNELKRKVLTARGIFLISTTLTGLLQILAWIIEPPSGWMGNVLSAVYVAAIFALPFAKRYAAWAIVVVCCIDEISPAIEGPNEGMGLMLSMLLLGYASHHWSDALAGASIVVSAGYDIYRFPEDTGYAFPQGAVGIALSYGIPYCCGIILWQRRSLRKAQKDRERLEAYQRDIAVASRIHEAVSGNLARIMLESQHLSDEGDEKTRRGVAEIGHDAEQALRDVHAVIDYLDDDGTHTRKLPQASYMETLESVVHAGDRRLHAQGIQGESVIQGMCMAAVDDRCMLSLEVLRETYTNIEKHARHEGDGYRLTVVVTGSRFMLSQTNSLPQEVGWMEQPQSGRGLELLAKRIRNYGGEMRWSKDEDIWSLFCELPLMDRAA